MVVLVQIALAVLVVFINYLVLGVLHGPGWLAFLATLLGLGVAWFAYLVYQARHPDWWPPWDEGLPQETRMMNAFVPVFIAYLFVLMVIPVFQQARQKAERTKYRQMLQQQKQNAVPPP